MSSFATVFDHRDFALDVRGDPPAGYPEAETPDTPRLFSAGTFESRRRAFLERCLRNPAPGNLKAPWYELPRLAAGVPVHQGIFHAACDFIDERRDCADFILHALLRQCYQLGGSRLAPDLRDRIRASILRFKYWPDEPGTDSLCSWTENHQILYASAGYLAGSLYPEERFASGGRRGRDLAAVHENRVRRWLDLRFRTGFSEWLSNV